MVLLKSILALAKHKNDLGLRTQEEVAAKDNDYSLVQRSRVLHVFITQERFAFQNRQFLIIALYSFHGQLCFDPQYESELLIFHLQVNSTAAI